MTVPKLDTDDLIDESFTHAVADGINNRVVGYAQITSNITGISSVTDLASVTWTADPTHRYWLRAYGASFLQNTTAALVSLLIATGGNAQRGRARQSTNGGGARHTMTAECFLSGLSGSQTFKMRIEASGGTVDVEAATTAPWFLVVIDMGAA